MRVRAIIAIVLFMTATYASYASTAASDTDAKLKAAIAAESRGSADMARDANRMPQQTLAFFGLRDDMKVLELVPGGGWYTKILSPVLAESGVLQVAIGTDRVQGMVETGALENVDVVPVSMSKMVRAESGRRFVIEDLTIDTSDVDMVLTFRNLHNFTESSRAQLNAEAFRVLKSGGLYGVVDHTRRHMQSDNSENWRRMDPVLMIKEIEAAGFKFVDFSDLHYRYDDELVYEVGRRSVTGNTDRFTLLFKKP